MRSLSDVSRLALQKIQEPPALFILFQKDCQACRQQVKDLHCLNKEVKIHLIGAFSSEKDLRTEYKKMTAPAPAYYGSKNVLRRLGVRARLTPQTFAFTKNKTFKFLGLTPCESIAEALKKGGR